MALVHFPEIVEHTIAAVGPELVEEMLHRDEHTLSHSLATGAMTVEAMQWAGCSEESIAIGAVAGVLHDIGKFSPCIQQLMHEAEGQKFTAGQVALMRTHTTRGFLRIARHMKLDAAQDTSSVSVAAYTALRHHANITQDAYDARPLHAGICHAVQLCDIVHARLFDAARTYRAARDGRIYTSQQVGRQIIAQFADFPPSPDGQQVPVEGLVMSWAARSDANHPGTLD